MNAEYLNLKVVEVHTSEGTDYLIADSAALEGQILHGREGVYCQVADRLTAEIFVNAVNAYRPDSAPALPADVKGLALLVAEWRDARRAAAEAETLDVRADANAQGKWERLANAESKLFEAATALESLASRSALADLVLETTAEERADWRKRADDAGRLARDFDKVLASRAEGEWNAAIEAAIEKAERELLRLDTDYNAASTGISRRAIRNMTDGVRAVLTGLRALKRPGPASSEWRFDMENAPKWSGEGIPPYVLLGNEHFVGVGYRAEPNYPDDPEFVSEDGEFIDPPPIAFRKLPAPPAREGGPT